MTEFDDVIRRLEDGRPQASAQELDEIKQRIRRRAAEPSRRSQSMKSRVAILGMLVTGMVFSTAGAGLALQGGSQTNAAVSQYGTPTPTPTSTPTATPICTETPSPGTTGGSGGTGTDTAGGDVCNESPVTPNEVPVTPTPTEGGGVLPDEETNAPSGGTAPAEETNNGGTAPAEEVERQQAAAAHTSQLPFTGFAAIPVLLGGLALLTGGLILRRRTN
jgi:hypothetical protein